MTERNSSISLPSADEIRRAVELYLAAAYGDDRPAAVDRLMPGEAFEPGSYLMSDRVERTPDSCGLREVRSFALRLGNRWYPHMKLRISRPPNERVYLFCVDCHDAMLQAPAGSPDGPALEQLKRHNASLAAAIDAAWDAAGLPTEKGFLRRKI